MWIYEKKLEYPVNIKTPNPKLAMAIISQLGGPDGELGASQRYLSQRYAMPYPKVAGLLTDIGTEELAPSNYHKIAIKKSDIRHFFHFTSNLSFFQVPPGRTSVRARGYFYALGSHIPLQSKSSDQVPLCHGASESVLSA